MSTTPAALLPRSFRFSLVGAASVALCAAGLLLGVTVDMAWLILFALGAFGPVLLRELGILRDLDEFQHELSVRAGHRAYIITGIFLCVVVIARQWGEANLDHDPIAASVALACLLVTYYMSYLTGFWGAQRAAARILVTFGTIWLVFILLSHGQEALSGEVLGFFAELILVLPFFALAWACQRWPRVAGALLIAAAAGAFLLFKLHRAFTGDAGALMVAMLFPLPLLITGLSLLAKARSAEE